MKTPVTGPLTSAVYVPVDASTGVEGHVFVKAGALPEGKQPGMLTMDELRVLLQK